MRTLRWRAISIVGALAALVSSPGVSVASELSELDCSYGGALPTLHNNGVECIASGSLKSKGTVVITSGSPMIVRRGVKLKLQRSGLVPGSLVINGGYIKSEADLTDSVVIDARDEIVLNDGFISLVAPFDDVRLRAATGDITLITPPLTGTRSTLEGDRVRLESLNGNITLGGMDIIATRDTADVVVPGGSFAVFDSSFSAGFGGRDECRFDVIDSFSFIGLNDPSNTFNCQVNVK